MGCDADIGCERPEKHDIATCAVHHRNGACSRNGDDMTCHHMRSIVSERTSSVQATDSPRTAWAKGAATEGSILLLRRMLLMPSNDYCISDTEQGPTLQELSRSHPYTQQEVEQREWAMHLAMQRW